MSQAYPAERRISSVTKRFTSLSSATRIDGAAVGVARLAIRRGDVDAASRCCAKPQATWRVDGSFDVRVGRVFARGVHDGVEQLRLAQRLVQHVGDAAALQFVAPRAYRSAT